MGCTSGIIKFLLFTFNLIFVIGGLILLIIGVVKKLDIDVSLKVIKSIHNLDIAPTMAIVVGTLIFFIAFLGCCGALKGNTCMLTTYGVIVLIFLVLQIVIAVFAFLAVSGADFEKTVTKDIQDQFNKYKNNSDSKTDFDNLQKGLKCCGVHASTDWLLVLDEIPASCCEEKKGPCLKANAFKTGCSQAVYDLIHDSLHIIAYVAIGFAAAQLVASIFAFCLVNSIKNEYRRGGY